MVREAWWAAVYGVAQSRTRLKELSSSSSRVDEEGMATHSSILAWRIAMDRGAWRATAYGVANSWTRLSD